MVQKVDRMPFFFDFSPKKNNCCRAHICPKIVHSLNNPLLSCPFFVKNTSILTKNTLLLYIFFKFLMKNLLLSCHVLSKKLQFCQNYLKYVIFSQKHFDLMSFFVLNFLWQPLLSCPYLIKKTSILSKLQYILDKKVDRMPFLLSFPNFVKKRPFSKKRTALKSIFSQKTSILSKTYALVSCFQLFHEKP